MPGILKLPGASSGESSILKAGKNAKTRNLLPLYNGSGEDAIKEENIDLTDPQNNIQKAIFSLIDETASDMVKNLKKAAAS